ncbi:hypothetical protein SAMN04487936_107210 [Halobacillus dabanensis]|uniref:Uncharacterized protein n=1 Tax=Halobacillus dabanensis TaxID=240302 RepID=A0A1I3WZ45_HALDA|nr:hypothetical protein [Halobacillus dabanensis]SFK12409.1 hypothetical protein SAMN04487936_107210 [Halobacillus dabanensis]
MDIKQQYQQQVDQEVKGFRNEVQKMKTSENPYYHDQAVLDYEIGQKRKELEKRVAEISDEFQKKIDEVVEAQEREAARSTFRVSTADRQLAEQFTTDLKAELTFSYSEADKRAAFNKFEEKIHHFDDESGLYAIKQKLPEVAQAVNDDEFSMKELRKINGTFNALQTPEAEHLEEIKQAKLSGVDTSFRRLRLTHPAYSDYQKGYKR